MNISKYMNLPARFIFCLALYSFLFLIFFIPVNAQGNLKYQGPLQIDKYRGIANYTYQVDQEDTILNGSFSIQSSNLHILHSKEDDFFSINGAFNAGLPVNGWRFRFGNFTAEEGAEFENYLFKVKVSGTQHTAIVNYEQGKPDGEWIHSIRKIEKSQVERTIFVSSSQFEDGVAQGYLRIKNDSLTMLGRFLRSGLAHDTWELNFNKELGRLEEWVFNNGRLEKIVITNDDEAKEEFLIYPEEIEQEKLVNLDHRYLKILALQNHFDSSYYKIVGGKMADLIQENASYYHKIENFIANIKGNASQSSAPIFFVKVSHYPLDNQQLENVAILKKNLQIIDSISRKLTVNTRLNILKHSDEEVLFLLSVLEEISENYILPVRRVVSYHEDDLLTYFPMDKLHWPLEINQESAMEIKVSYQDSSGIKNRTYTGPEQEKFNTSNTGISYLLDLNEYALNSVTAIEKRLKGKINSYNVQKELEDLEKILLQEEDSLIFLVDSLNNMVSGIWVNQSLQALKTVAISELTHYAADDDLIAKPENARQLIGCMKSLQVLAVNLAKTPARVEEIKELYTEQVWNPFTATIMKDQVKQRLTDAYVNVLIPYIHQQIENELTCSDPDKYSSLLNTLYDKMIKLRKQDTAKMERKLKNENDPQVILQLFELAM